MDLDKAIKINTTALALGYTASLGDFDNATRLGIEALKYIIRLRACSLQHRGTRLPGETPGTSETFPDETLKKLQESPLGREPKG